MDTALVFPHRRGPPLKRALRNLMKDHLNKIIQDDVGKLTGPVFRESVHVV